MTKLQTTLKEKAVLEKALEMAAKKCLDSDNSFACTEMGCPNYSLTDPTAQKRCVYSECLKANVAHFKVKAEKGGR